MNYLLLKHNLFLITLKITNLKIKFFIKIRMDIQGLNKIIDKINLIKCSQNIEIVIDTRETKLLNYMKGYKFVKISQLDVGDIHYRINGKTFFIIERKTLEDLANSIKDGRFREQKIRLQKCLSQDISIIYLIEGNLDSKFYKKHNKCKINGIPLNTIIGAQINIIIRDMMQTLKTSCLEASVLVLFDIYKKLKINYQNYIDKSSKHKLEYVDSIQIRKKDNMDKNNCIIIQLSQIPGVSIHIAKAIIAECQSITNLCMAYSNFENEEQKEKFLETITYSVPGGKSRKVGKVVSKRIYEYLN